MKNDDCIMKMTEKGDDKLRELCEKSFEWLEPDNTIGDFFTVLFENVVNEMLSDEIKNIQLKDLEDPEKSKKALGSDLRRRELGYLHEDEDDYGMN